MLFFLYDKNYVFFMIYPCRVTHHGVLIGVVVYTFISEVVDGSDVFEPENIILGIFRALH